MFRLICSGNRSARLMQMMQTAIGSANRRLISSDISSKQPEVDLRPDPNETIQVELFKTYQDESTSQKRARLLYQSRKRGMLENDLLLSCFADKYLYEFDAEQLDQYDQLINGVSNDWDLFYWATGKKQIPTEFDTPIMKRLQEFALNLTKESRIRQPDLK